ncbi:conserved Plasmodium protein, unknown function [Plasmodium relictum]|uniref:Uncharacterized protein n=1 Tax=Plasmodium relictum TaxID=85471 RepID=A0A1J1H9V7_PLARL|nr:conserved Plasmodium protein, unknown function [Plasmodium relictum]CRH01414.1 conserved Plasmodium protein, unknown function [Plasmodium relictum]
MNFKNEKINDIKNNFKSDSTGFIITESYENHNEECGTNISELREDKRKKKKKTHANDEFSDNIDAFYSNVLKSKKIKGKENKVKTNTVKDSENFYDCFDTNYISENKSQKLTSKTNKKKELLEINKNMNENNNINNDNNIDKEKNINEMLLKDNINIDKQLLCSNLNKNDQVIGKKRKGKKNAETKIENNLKKTRKEYIKKYKYKNSIEYNEDKRKSLSNNNNLKKNDKENFIDELSMNSKDKNTSIGTGGLIDKLNMYDNENNEMHNRKNNFNLDNLLSNEKPYYCSNFLENEALADTSEKTLNSYCNADVDNSTESILGSISKSNNNYDIFYVNNKVKDFKSEELIDIGKVACIDNKKKKSDFKKLERKIENNESTEIAKINNNKNIINANMYANNNVENKDGLITQTSIPPVVEKKKRGRKRKIQKNLEFLVNTYKKTSNTENDKLPKIHIYKKEKKNDVCNNQLFELNDYKYISNNMNSFDESFSLKKNAKFCNNNSAMQTRRKSKEVKSKDEKYSPYADYIYNKNGGKRKYTKRKYKKKYMTSSIYPTDISINAIKYKNNKALENKRLFPNEIFMNKDEFMNNINNINTIFNFNEEFLKFLYKVSKCKDIDYDLMLSFLGDIQVKLSENIQEEFSNEFCKSHNVDDTVYAMNQIVDILNNNNEILSKLNQLEYKFYYDYLKNKSKENQINGNINEIKKNTLENNSRDITQDFNESSKQLQINNINNSTINKEYYTITNENGEDDKKINDCSFSKGNLEVCDVQSNKILTDDYNNLKKEDNNNSSKNNISSMNNENGFTKFNNLYKKEDENNNYNSSNNNNNNTNNDVLLRTLNSESLTQNSTDFVNKSKIISNDLYSFNGKNENIKDGETVDKFSENNNDTHYYILKEINNSSKGTNNLNKIEYKYEDLHEINYQNNIDFVCDELNKLIKETLKNESLFYSKPLKKKYENISERILYKNYISTKIYKNSNLINKRNEDMCLKYSNDSIYENREDNKFLKKYTEFFRKLNFINSKSKLHDINDNIKNQNTTIDEITNCNFHSVKENYNDNGDTLHLDMDKMNDCNYRYKCNLNDEYNSKNINKVIVKNEYNNNNSKNYLNEKVNINNDITASDNSKKINCSIKDDGNEKNEEYAINQKSEENKEKKDNLTNISDLISFFKIKTEKNEENENVKKMENKNNETNEERDIMDKEITNNFNHIKEVNYYDVNENNFLGQNNEKKKINNLSQEIILVQDNHFLKKKYDTMLINNDINNSQNDELKNYDTLKNVPFDKFNVSTESNSSNDKEKKILLDDKKKFIENNLDIKNSIIIENNYDKGDNEYITNISHIDRNIKKEIIFSVKEKEDDAVNKDIKNSLLDENDIFYNEINKDKKNEYNSNTEEGNMKLKNIEIITNNLDSNSNDKANSSFLLKEELNDVKTKFIDYSSNKNNFLKSEKKNDTLSINHEDKEAVNCYNLNISNNTVSNDIDAHNKKTINSLLKETFDLKNDEIINIKTDKTQKEILDCLSMISKIKKIFFDECTKMINNQIYLLEKNFRIPNCSLSILKNSFGYNSNK